jgi:hypothetical protein
MQDQDNERWAAVPGFPEYEVSDRGRVRRAAPSPWSLVGKELAQRPVRGYLRVGLCRGGKVFWRSIHRLVWEAFVAPIPEGLTINHRDGVKTNNALSNLEVMTQRENIHHAIQTGLRVSAGEGNPKAKITEDIVRQIRARPGENWKALAEEFGVSKFTIWDIRKGRTWASVK